MDDCVKKVQAKGHGKDSAIGICYASIVEGQSAALDFVLKVDEFTAQPEWGDMYLVDEYVNTKPGEPYRLFPFGRIVKNGKARDITPEYAARFKLPHFKPAIKRGSHAETTPADGHIVGLEVRQDGLYAIPELNETGEKDLKDGAYRYHSPEVIWEDSGLEDPQTGKVISGPLIVGDALLHMPHLGEAAALYEITPLQGGETMEEVKIPMSLWEKFLSVVHIGGEPKPEPEKETVEVIKPPEDYEVLKVKVTEYEAEKQRMEADLAQKARVENFAAQLKETKVAEGADILAGMTDAQAEWVMTQFKALSAQVQESNLTGEIGSTGEALPADPKEALNKAILAKAEELKSDYVTAYHVLASEKPELFAAGK